MNLMERNTLVLLLSKGVGKLFLFDLMRKTIKEILIEDLFDFLLKS